MCVVRLFLCPASESAKLCLGGLLGYLLPCALCDARDHVRETGCLGPLPGLLGPGCCRVSRRDMVLTVLAKLELVESERLEKR